MIVKTCGITNKEDALFALQAGTDWIGLNHVAGPRRISLETIARIVDAIDDASRAVILVNAKELAASAELAPRLKSIGVRRLQVYGGATDWAEWIAVRHLKDGQALDSRQALLGEERTDDQGVEPSYVLLDAHAPNQLGGSGRTVDWTAIGDAMSRIGREAIPPILLAGGLTLNNVAEAVRTVMPAGVDVSSGVEHAPGRKDHAKIAAFVEAARSAG